MIVLFTPPSHCLMFVDCLIIFVACLIFAVCLIIVACLHNLIFICDCWRIALRCVVSTPRAVTCLSCVS